ncbi:hypothetical protein [Thauera sp.]|jgi:hypothetical protein|uniref:hypothetical protein n=1 Tax=Thauera sp. TaxID=1905334 RepID=UPI002A35ACF9|nr:hypothetical protein [Thauera sp.]MDX9886643.1 hypothetical protein [Thauera sp.]
MNAKMHTKRAGMLFAIAAAAVIPMQTGAESLALAPQAAVLVAQDSPTVVDKEAVAPLDLMLFVHRPDLPLRAVPTKYKDHS